MKKKIKKVLFISLILFFAILLKSTKTMAASIPKVYFEGDISNMVSKTDERNIILRYVSDDLSFEKYIKIKIQGDSSLAYEKKNYTIKLYKDDSYSKKEKVDVGKGWGAQSKYCLKANWIDKTHSRNIVSARLAAKMQEKYNLFMDTPNNGLIDGFPVEIYINDEFLGLYTWNIPKDEWMYNMDSDNPNHIAIVGKANTDSTRFMEKITSIDNILTDGWEIEIGPETQDTIDKFNRVLDFVINSSDEEFKRDFELYINKDAAFNYLMFLYISSARDNNSKNLIMVTYDGNIWYPTLYDLDTTFGSDWRGKELYAYDLYLPEIDTNVLWKRMVNVFTNEISERWFELRKDIFAKDYIMNEFNRFKNSIPEESFIKEGNRWENIPGYDLDQIDDYLSDRIPYIDNIMSNRYNPEIIEDYELGYEINNENQIINIKARTPIEDFKRIFINNNDLEVIIKDEQNVNNRYASTGMKINIRNSNGEFILDEENNPATYTLVVKGDVTGDGIADAKDHVYIKAHRMELQGGALENEYFKAGDLNNDGKINYVDSNLLLLHRSEVQGYSLDFIN